MTDRLMQLLGFNENDPLISAATDMVDNDHEHLAALREARIREGLTVTDVANRMGVVEEDVVQMETYHADPTLSNLRRYALAVNMKHSITLTPIDSETGSNHE